MLNHHYRMHICLQRLSAMDLIGWGQRCCLFLNKLVLSNCAGHPVGPLRWRASQGGLPVFPFWLLSSQFTCWCLSEYQEPQSSPMRCLSLCVRHGSGFSRVSFQSLTQVTNWLFSAYLAFIRYKSHYDSVFSFVFFHHRAMYRGVQLLISLNMQKPGCGFFFLSVKSVPFVLHYSIITSCHLMWFSWWANCFIHMPSISQPPLKCHSVDASMFS